MIYIERWEWTLTSLYIPESSEMLAGSKIRLGDFPPPSRSEFISEQDYAEAYAKREEQVIEQALEILNDHYLDTTNVEIRLSETYPGEIMLYV